MAGGGEAAGDKDDPWQKGRGRVRTGDADPVTEGDGRDCSPWPARAWQCCSNNINSSHKIPPGLGPMASCRTAASLLSARGLSSSQLPLRCL